MRESKFKLDRRKAKKIVEETGTEIEYAKNT